MSFTPNSVLQRALQIGDMYEIAGALIGYIDGDPQFWTGDFDRALDYVLSNGVSESQLFKAFDPSFRFESNPANWVDDYYSYARLYLQKNFCRERLDHVKAVARKKYGSKPAPKPTLVSQSRTTVQQSQISKKANARQERRAQGQSNHTNANSAAIAMGIVVALIIVIAIVVIVNI